MTDPQTTVRPFSAADFEPACALSAAEGWNQTRSDWTRVVQYQPEGSFVAVREGRVAGTVTTTRYSTDLAWIGMMLVAPDFRRRGIATELMQTAIGFLRSRNVNCIKLDATPVGESVYSRLGFVREWAFHRWSRTGSEEPAISANGASFDPDDRIAFGADRRAWLARLAADSLVHCHGDGFGMLRSGRTHAYLGPISARTPAAAYTIVTELLQATRAPAFWDIPGPNTAAADLATQLGFTPVRDLTRMRLGRDIHQADLSRQFAIADPGVG